MKLKKEEIVSIANEIEQESLFEEETLQSMEMVKTQNFTT